MTPAVSRALAAFIAATGIGREAARRLAGQYANARSVAELPEWITEKVSGGDHPSDR